MIPWLNSVLFHMGQDAVTWAELLGFITGGLCVWLTVRRHVANFPVGILNSALFLVLFWSARLWADSSLQVLYIVLGVVGWWQWLHGGRDHGPLQVRQSSAKHLLGCTIFVLIATAALTILLRSTHDASPFLDALTTSLSLAAQWLLNGKRFENWLFWIAADLIYIPLYAVRRLDLTALVYVLFLGLCVAGVREWRRGLLLSEEPE